MLQSERWEGKHVSARKVKRHTFQQGKCVGTSPQMQNGPFRAVQR
jgi:hypothetical protein